MSGARNSAKKEEDFVKNSQFLVPKYFRDRKIQSLVQKYFLQKMLQKKRANFVQNSPFLVPNYFQR